jgi:hypothetical protein
MNVRGNRSCRKKLADMNHHRIDNNTTSGTHNIMTLLLYDSCSKSVLPVSAPPDRIITIVISHRTRHVYKRLIRVRKHLQAGNKK